LEEHGDAIAEEIGLPLELILALAAIPSYYLRYFYATEEVLREQQSGHVRAERVAEIERSLLDMYRDPTLDAKPALLEQRGGAYYSLAAIQLIASLHDGAGDVQVVDVLNRGSIRELPDDAVVEIPARIDAHGAHPVRLEPLPSEMVGLIQHVKAYELLAVRAARTGDRATALRALVANPLVGAAAAPELLDQLLEANRAFLPRFFPR
jgi:6-phospho-beta-glucosidase